MCAEAKWNQKGIKRQHFSNSGLIQAEEKCWNDLENHPCTGEESVPDDASDVSLPVRGWWFAKQKAFIGFALLCF